MDISNKKNEPDIAADHILVRAEKVIHLQKLELMHEIQGELLAWAKRRFWAVAVVGTVVAVVGINTLAFSIVFGLLEERIEKATEATALATHATASANESSKKATEKASLLSERLETLDAEARAVEKQFKAVRGDVDAETSNVRAKLESQVAVIRTRLDELDTVLRDIAARTPDAEKALSDYKDKVTKLTAQSERISSEFTENSQFRIEVVSVTRNAPSEQEDRAVAKLADQLTTKGFKTSIGGLGSYFYFPKWDSSDEPSKIAVVYRDDYEQVAKKIKSSVSSFVQQSVELLTFEEQKTHSRGGKRGFSDELGDQPTIPNDVNIVVAYLMRERDLAPNKTN